MEFKVEEITQKEKSYKIVSGGKTYYAEKKDGKNLEVGKTYEVVIRESTYVDSKGETRTSKWLVFGGSPQSATPPPTPPPQQARILPMPEPLTTNANLYYRAMQLSLAYSQIIQCTDLVEIKRTAKEFMTWIVEGK